MKVYELNIPPECRKVVVSQSEKGLEIFLEPQNYGDKFLEATGRVESIPRLDEFAIFWNKDENKEAHVGLLKDFEPAAELKERGYKSNVGKWYDYAIKFRDDVQLKSIIAYDPEK